VNTHGAPEHVAREHAQAGSGARRHREGGDVGEEALRAEAALSVAMCGDYFDAINSG
jgi:hypothetical protein